MKKKIDSKKVTDGLIIAGAAGYVTFVALSIKEHFRMKKEMKEIERLSKQSEIARAEMYKSYTKPSEVDEIKKLEDDLSDKN